MVEVLSRYRFLDHILEDNNKKNQSCCSEEEITLDLE